MLGLQQPLAWACAERADVLLLLPPAPLGRWAGARALPRNPRQKPPRELAAGRALALQPFFGDRIYNSDSQGEIRDVKFDFGYPIAHPGHAPPSVRKVWPTHWSHDWSRRPHLQEFFKGNKRIVVLPEPVKEWVDNGFLPGMYDGTITKGELFGEFQHCVLMSLAACGRSAQGAVHVSRPRAHHHRAIAVG